MVSAPSHDNGAVYTFNATSGDQLQKFSNADTPESWWFGFSHGMVIHAGTNVGIVGHSYEDRGLTKSGAGAVYVFDLNTGKQIRKLTPAVSAAGMYFGTSLLLSGDYL